MEIQSANLHQHNIARRIEKGWSFHDSSIKNGIAYTTVTLLLLAAVSFFSESLHHYLSAQTTGYVFALAYLVCGMAHIFIFPKWLPSLFGIKGFVYTILLSLVTSLVAVTIFIITAFDGGLLPLTAASAFMLPSAISLCWHYFSGFTSRQYSEWYIPADMQPEKRMSLLLNSLAFKVKIKVLEDNKDTTIFTVTLSGKLTTGGMFYRFLYDQKGTIETTGPNLVEYGWLFYAERWLGPVMLDPALSLYQNGIKEGDIILVERVVK